MDTKITENTQLSELEDRAKKLPVSNRDKFAEAYKMAAVYSKSGIIPANYQGKVEDCAIAIDMANRMDVSPIMVMQNLYVVKGKPSWSGQACISFLKRQYANVMPHYVGTIGEDDRGCYFTATDKVTGEEIRGTTVTIAMAKSEGWYSKKDKYGKETSKWSTMSEQMLAYRAAAFFARVYCPDVLMGCAVESEEEAYSNPASTVEVVEGVL